MPKWTFRGFGIAVLALTLLGLFAGTFLGAFPGMWKHGRAHDWPWWHYALAVPAMGVLYLLGEAMAAVLFAPFAWLKDWESPWKQVLHYSLVAALMFALVAGLVWAVSIVA